MRASPPSKDDRDVVDAYNGVELELLRWSSTPLPAFASPIVLAVVKDEIEFIGDFLTHYRTLGVERFAIIDNGSSDGTLQHLLMQPDVDVFRTAQRFEWKQKQAWINRAVDYYGVGRWYITADADERLSFQDCETRSVQDLVAFAEKRGLSRVRGFLLEMYSDLPIILAASSDIALKDAYPFFDADGYSEERLPHIISRLGGVRARAFGESDPEFKPQLTKYPVFRLDAGDVFSNPHHVWPYEANFSSPCFAAVLHYKFHGDWTNRVARAVADKNYWDGSREYRAYADAIAKRPGLSLWTAEDSRRHTHSSDFVAHGLVEAIDWSLIDGDAQASRAAELQARIRVHRAERLKDIGRSAEAGIPGQGPR